MAATGPWANLGRDVLASITDASEGRDGLSLGDYARLRSVCTAWRSTIAPPFPSLLGLADGGRRAPVRASVFSLPARRSFRHLCMGTSCALDGSLYDDLFKLVQVQPVQSHASIVGSGSGRLAVAIHSQESVSGSSQTKQWTAKIFLLHPRSGEEVELRPPTRDHDQRVRKVVFAPNPPRGGPNDWPTVVAMYGRNKVAYIDATRSKEWTAVHIPYKFLPLEDLVDLAFDAGGQNVYCLDKDGGVRVLRIHHLGQNTQEPLLSPGPLLVSSDVAPPYGLAIQRNPSKHLFFCNGSVYQVWQQTKRTYGDEILVLRFHPGRRPYWDAVKDLGGCSVFIGENSDPAVVRGARGVRADCVYWINNKVVGVPKVMVYDVATGTSTLDCKEKGNCWLFDDNNVTTGIDDKTQKRKRCSRYFL